MKNFGQRKELPLNCTDVHSGDAIKPEKSSDLQSGAGFSSDEWSLESNCRHAQIEQKDRKLPSCWSVSAAANEKNTKRQGRLVTPYQSSEDPSVEETQQRKKQRYKAGSAGRQKYVAPKPNETEDNVKVCAWLRSLEIVDSNPKNSIASNNLQPPSAARRDQFLPHINQVEPYQHVPLLNP